MTTCGTPTAAAMCATPLSLPTKSEAREASRDGHARPTQWRELLLGGVSLVAAPERGRGGCRVVVQRRVGVCGVAYAARRAGRAREECGGAPAVKVIDHVVLLRAQKLR